MNILITYFSRTGENAILGASETITKGYTEIVAEKIAAITGGELYKLVPEVPYPENYEECVKRAREESQNNIQVPFLNPKDNLDAYDYIFVGFPNWYRSYPRIVSTFLKKYDFTGKTIIPFCTNEEGAFGIGELELRSAVKGALVKNGYAVKSHLVNDCDTSLKEYLRKVL